MELTVAGKRVHASTGGAPFDAARPAVAFLHGAGLDHSIWALAARLFAQEGRAVLALDLPGHGRSEGPPLASIDAMADWLLAALDAAGAKEARLAGFSMGSAIAIEAAARAPERIKALALLGAAPAMPVHPDLLALAEANDPKAIDLMVAWCHGPTGHLGGQPAAGLWVLGASRRLLERAAPGVLAADLAACAAWQDGLETAARLRCPTLLVTGEKDVMTPLRGARKLAAAIPGAELLPLADAGHMILAERPNETLDALRRIL